MPNHNTILIATIGLSQQDQGVLNRLFQLTKSQTRSRSYALTQVTSTPPPDLLLVDTDDENAKDEWQLMCNRKSILASRPTVWVSQTAAPADAHDHHIQRPFLAPRVLRILDNLTIEKESKTASTSSSLKRALIIDDSLPVRKQVEIELGYLEIQADLAENGAQAFTFLNSATPYDIICLDVVLPDIDGYSICKAIKKNKERRDIPVIMLTGKGSPFDRVRGKLAGCDTYLIKPVTRETLQVAIEQSIN